MIEAGINRNETKEPRPVETVLPTRVRRASEEILEAYSRKSASGHIFGAHNWQYGRVRILPGAKYMVTVNRDKTLKIWGFPSGKLIESIHTDISDPRALAVSDDGGLVFVAANRESVIAWDTRRKGVANTFGGHSRFASAVAYCSRQSLLVTGDMSGTVRIWDCIGNDSYELSRQGEPVWTICACADGSLVAAGDDKGGLRVWELSSEKLLHDFAGGTQAIKSLAMDTEGKKLFSGGKDGVVRGFDLESGEQVFLKSWHPLRIRALASVGEGALLVAATKTDTVDAVWECFSGKRLSEVSGFQDSVCDFAFAPDGDYAVGVSLNGTARIFDLKTGECVKNMTSPFCAATRIQACPHGKSISCIDEKGRLSIREIGAGKVPSGKGPAVFENMACLSYSPQGIKMVAGCLDGTVNLIDPARMHPVKRIGAHEKIATAAAVLADGKRVLTGSSDRTARLWDMENSSCIRVFELRFPVSSVAVAPKSAGGWLAAGDISGHVVLWRSEDDRRYRALKGHKPMAFFGGFPGPGIISGLAFVPSSEQLLSTSHDGTIKLWDLGKGICLRTYRGHDGPVTGLATTDDRHFISAGIDGKILEWDLATGEQRVVFADRRFEFQSLALLPDSPLAMAGDRQGAVHFIDLAEGKPAGAFWNVRQGFLWTVPPDEFAPEGWLWTDRFDLISVLERRDGEFLPRVLPENHPGKNEYLKSRNSEKMVATRIFDPESYRGRASRFLNIFRAKTASGATAGPKLIPKTDCMRIRGGG